MTQIPLQPASEDIWDKKYRLRSKSNEVVDQTIEDTYRRVAHALASVEPTNRSFWENEFYKAMNTGAIPAGRIMSNAGANAHKPNASTINCTVSNTIHDSMHGILQGVYEGGITLSAGCGIGYDFTTLRPRHAYVAGVGAKTSGALSFMNIYDSMCFTVASAGGRRGAQMGTLDVRHPDIEAFITAKREDGRLRQFNLSVLITDEFMRAVDNDEEWKLIFPVNPKEDMQGKESVWADWPVTDGYQINPSTGQVRCRVYKTVRALDLWNSIMESNYNFAEPGFILIDRYNTENNNWFCENIRATNPCFTGETLVWTDKGQKRFSDLAEDGSSVNVLTQLPNGKLVYSEMTNPRKTQKDAAIVRVHFDDGTFVDCTPSHKIFLKSGEGKEAQSLNAGDRIESVYRYRANQKGYLRLSNGADAPLEHHIPFRDIPNGYEVHHKDEIKSHNYPDNLELLEGSEHRKLHMEGANNPSIRFPERNVLLQRDHSGKNNGRYRNDIDDDKLKELRDQGLSFLTIANQVGCSEYTVMKRLGWERPSNHRVVRVEKLDIKTDVYCGTVKETGKFFIAVAENNGILVSNCGEQGLPPYGACLLGSINLTHFVVRPFEQDAYFDEELFVRVVKLFTRMLDNVVGLNGLPLEKQREEIRAKRRHGMGYFGLGSALAMLRMKYGSEESVEFTRNVTRKLAVAGLWTGVQLAKEKGEAPILKKVFMEHSGQKGRDLLLQSGYMKRLAKHEPRLVQAIREFGLRFTHHSSIAPTGTMSLSFGNNASNGIEPSFAHEYERNIIREGRNAKEAVKVYSYEALLYRSIHGQDAKLPDYFSTTDDISPEDHIKIQAAAQEWIDSSISKTVNVPSDISFEDFKNVYRLGYQKGCKGVSTFRFNPAAFQGVLVKTSDLEATKYIFKLEDGTTQEFSGNEMVEYEGQTHSAANLFDALKENTYGKF